MRYRPEIDGLRAVAVIPVILFHTGIYSFAGGFVGVDVFFVISGYLITLIILREKAEGTFRLSRFWERRARRLLPALYVVMLACIPVAWVVMLPGQYLDFARSLVAVGLFASNILFWRETDYFAAAAEEKPLLHTWSLSVEEQFYILYPFLLAMLWRIGRGRAGQAIPVGLCVLAMGSLGLSHIAAQIAPSANFYLLPTRAWELLVGALCAVYASKTTSGGHGGLATLGLTLILGSILFFDASTPFPSLWTLFPVIGTSLIILFAGPQNWIGRLLSLKVVVGIGLISYSAYLWHQPLMAFARIIHFGTPPMVLMLLLAALSLPLAWLTWRYVEQPFRQPTGAFSRPRHLAAALLPVWAFLVAVGIYGHTSDGAIHRLTPEEVAMLQPRRSDTSPCRNRFSPAELAAGARCLIGDLNATPDIAVIGDSHAASLTDALSDALLQEGRSAIMLRGNWCAPLVNFSTQVPRKSRDCMGRMTEGISSIAADAAISKVLLVAQWSNYTLGSRPGDPEPAAYTYAADLPFRVWNADLSANPDMVALALDDTLGRLARPDRHILLLGPVPEYPASVPDAMVRVTRFGGDSASFVKQDLALHDARHAIAQDILSNAALEASHRVAFWSPRDHLCPEGTCVAVAPDGTALYEDAHHLSYAGAVALLGAERLRTLLSLTDAAATEPQP